MIKAFALVAILFPADGPGESFVLDSGLTAQECAAAIAPYADGTRLLVATAPNELMPLKRGDIIACEFVK